MASDPPYANCLQDNFPKAHAASDASTAWLDLAATTGPLISPATPFLTKTYELVDDPDTNSVISWGYEGKSFVVWSPADLCKRLLPCYFKHSNFASFIRQLNTYGFRKISPERWEFANDEFGRGQRHLLSGIHRRRRPTVGPTVGARRRTARLHLNYSTMVSQSNCCIGETGETCGDEYEIESLKEEKKVLMRELLSLQNQLQSSMGYLQTMWQRLQMAEKCQQRMLTFIHKAMHSPGFLAQFTRQPSTVVTAGIAQNLVQEKWWLPDIHSVTSSTDSVMSADTGAPVHRLPLHDVPGPHGQQCQKSVQGRETDQMWQEVKEMHQLVNPLFKAPADEEQAEDAKLMRSTVINYNCNDNVLLHGGDSYVAQDGSNNLMPHMPLHISKRLHICKQKGSVQAINAKLRESSTVPLVSSCNRYHASAADMGPLMRQVHDEYFTADTSTSLLAAHFGYGCFKASDMCST